MPESSKIMVVFKQDHISWKVEATSEEMIVAGNILIEEGLKSLPTIRRWRKR